MSYLYEISIHAPLAWCDRRGSAANCRRRRFQSTHPSRGATHQALGSIHHFVISIHAPLAGCDSWGAGDVVAARISIHAPLAGCDGYSPKPRQRFFYFNPRTPRGVRPLTVLK